MRPRKGDTSRKGDASARSPIGPRSTNWKTRHKRHPERGSQTRETRHTRHPHPGRVTRVSVFPIWGPHTRTRASHARRPTTWKTGQTRHPSPVAGQRGHATVQIQGHYARLVSAMWTPTGGKR